ncbi:MAG: response regulator [Proteobacteria bacterium]|nr:response regulator [Pseudomonadota bacterium]
MRIPPSTGTFGLPPTTGTTGDAAQTTQVTPIPVLPSLDILLVDDDLLSLTCEKLLLEKEGHRVTAVNSGELALEYAQVRSYDLALMGLTLPGLSGEQTAMLIRDPLGGAISPGLPIIALSSLGGRQVRESCAKAGMDAFLPKPILWEDMQHAIRTTLALRGKRQAA